MQDRRRNGLILGIVAGLAIISLLVIVGLPGVVKPKKTRLGLDLRGGVALVYKGKPTAQSKVNAESLNRAIDIIRKRVDQLGVSSAELLRTGASEIEVRLPDVTNAHRAEEEVGKTAQLFFYDWEPNVIGPSGQPEPTEEAVTGGPNAGNAEFGLPEYEAVERAAKRPATTRGNETTYDPGCTPAQVKACIYGSWYLLDTAHKQVLRGPEETEQNLYADNFKAPHGAKLKAVRVNPGTILVRARPIESGGKVTKELPNSFYVLNDDPVLSGADIRNPQQSFENGASGNGQPIVTFGFSEHGAKVFERVTREIAKRGQEAQLPGVTKERAQQHFAIVLDEQLITVPFIDYTANPEGIDATNGSQIQGGFTLESAQNLAQELQSGALPIKLELISQSQVSATLGKEALNQGLIAGLVGLAVVCLFLISFYRILGLIAVGGLAIYGLYFFALIKLIPITLTLPSIAGLILTIGVAADANIVIFERIKEEIRSGRSMMAGIAVGYKRGFAAIIDANVVTFMTAFILFALATAQVQGFAFMLGIGTLVSLFTAVLATQAALGTMAHSRVIAHPMALGASGKKRVWKFDFMGKSRWFFSLSGTILLIGALALGGKGLTLGIDFNSGTRIQTAFVRPANVEQIRSAVKAAGFSGAQVQSFKSKGVGGSGYQISLRKLHPNQLQTLREKLDSRFATKNFSSTSIGPSFGRTVANSAVIAIIASLLVISAYIALRFEWKYAVPVLIALMHDLLITAGVYALTGREVTAATVAALLTILGYSLYDTIIVFDRVRENVPRMPRAAFSQIVNRSMSEVLTRSLATSFCTLLPVLSLLLFGGETLKDFAFALMVGIASGAYSSIFIASPVLTHWKERESVYANRRERIIEDLGRVPAYATAVAGAPVDVEPPQRRRRRTGLADDEPGGQISREEFDEMVRELDIDEAPARGGGVAQRVAAPARTATPPPQERARREERARQQQAAREQQAARGQPEPEPPADTSPENGGEPPEPAADLTPEELVIKDKPARRTKSRRSRNRRHGRAR